MFALQLKDIFSSIIYIIYWNLLKEAITIAHLHCKKQRVRTVATPFATCSCMTYDGFNITRNLAGRLHMYHSRLSYVKGVQKRPRQNSGDNTSSVGDDVIAIYH